MHTDELLSRISSATKIIEICGPTPGGFEFLKKINASFSVPPTITNIENPITLYPHSDNPQVFNVDEVADVKNLPYENESIDILLVSSLPLRDLKGSDAEAEYNNPDWPVHNLHLYLYKEAQRVLKPKGLLIQVNPFPEDGRAANHYKFREVINDEPSCTVIFEK